MFASALLFFTEFWYNLIYPTLVHPETGYGFPSSKVRGLRAARERVTFGRSRAIPW